MANTSDKIDVDAIKEKIKLMEDKQKDLENAYQKIKANKNKLESSWNGKAADKFYQAFDIISDRRYQRIIPVDQYYIPYLEQYIVNGYVDVEKLNHGAGHSFDTNAALEEFME